MKVFLVNFFLNNILKLAYKNVVINIKERGEQNKASISE